MVLISLWHQVSPVVIVSGSIFEALIAKPQSALLNENSIN